jgi:phosphoglycolate phosphatase
VKQNPRLHDKADQLLQLLADNNIHMAVVSNKRNPLLSAEVAIFGFGRFFKKVLGAGEASADKPDPAPLLHTLEAIGIAPGPHVWYLGDSHTDMMCAIGAGCTAVLFESKPPPADLLIKNPPAARFRSHGELMEYVARYFT